jgi:hypothetical protein
MAEDESGTGQAPDPKAKEGGGNGEGGEHGNELTGLTPEAQAAVREARKEASGYRRRLRETEQRLQSLEQERESETDKAVREAEQRGREAALAEAQTKLLRAEVKAAAAARRFRDAADVMHLASDGELLGEADDERRDKLLADELDRIAEAKPYLLDSGGDNGEQREQRGLVSQGARSGKQPSGSGTSDPDAWLRRKRRRG